MGMAENMNKLADGMKSGVKMGSTLTVIIFIRLITALFLGLTVALIGQEVSHYGTLSLIFVTLLVTTVFMRISRAWTLAHILIFDLVMVLVAQVLRMYILLAP